MNKPNFTNLIQGLIKYLNAKNDTSSFSFTDNVSSTLTASNHVVRIRYLNEEVYALYYDLYKDDNQDYIVRQFYEEFDYFKRAMSRINFHEIHKEVKRIEERNRINDLYANFNDDLIANFSCKYVFETIK